MRLLEYVINIIYYWNLMTSFKDRMFFLFIFLIRLDNFYPQYNHFFVPYPNGILQNLIFKNDEKTATLIIKFSSLIIWKTKIRIKFNKITRFSHISIFGWCGFRCSNRFSLVEHWKAHFKAQFYYWFNIFFSKLNFLFSLSRHKRGRLKNNSAAL